MLDTLLFRDHTVEYEHLQPALHPAVHSADKCWKGVGCENVLRLRPECAHAAIYIAPGNRLAGAELPAPRVKLAAADPVQPAHQRGRRSWRHALRQYPKLLFEAPASPALRTSENLAANLASPRMSTPEGLIIDQRRVIHCIAAAKGGKHPTHRAKRKTTFS